MNSRAGRGTGPASSDGYQPGGHRDTARPLESERHLLANEHASEWDAASGATDAAILADGHERGADSSRPDTGKRVSAARAKSPPPQIQGLTPYITPIQAGPSNLPETPSEPSLKRLPDQNRLSRLKHFARTRPRLLFPYALAGLILLLLVSGLGSVYWFTRPHVQLDVPPGTPNLVNPRIAPVALLEFDPTKQVPPGYLYHINVHLNGVLNSPGATPEQARLATQIDNDLNNVKGWLQQVRLDAKQLITMPAGDLLSNNTLNILDNMETYARYAYVGKLDPSNNQIQGGVTQIYYQGQALATMGVMEYNGG